jgi:hypothetical protein
VKKKAKYIRGPMLTIMGLELRIVVSGARRINKIIRGEERRGEDRVLCAGKIHCHF